MRTDSEIKLLIRRRNWRCDIYQGYVCSRPVPAAALAALLG